MLNISTKPTASLRQGLEKASGSTPFYVDHEKKKSRVAQSIEPQLNLVFGAIKGSRGQIVLFNKQPKEKSPLVTFFLSNEKQNKTNRQKRGKQKIKQAQIPLPCSPRTISLFGDDDDGEKTRASGTRESQGHSLVGSRVAYFARCSKWRTSSQAISRLLQQ